MNYHIGRLVLSRNKSSHTQRTENKTTDVVIHPHIRKLLKMDILMSETCRVHNKWNKIASDIELVFHSSTIAMMHGPINIRFTYSSQTRHISSLTYSHHHVIEQYKRWIEEEASSLCKCSNWNYYIIIPEEEIQNVDQIKYIKYFWIWHSEDCASWHILIIKANEMHSFSNLFRYRTLHVSDRPTVHHQEYLNTVYTW